MEINWLPNIAGKKENIPILIQAEYAFRSKMMRVFLEELKGFEDDDLDLVSFDFDTSMKSFQISPKTPEPIYSQILRIKHLLD